MHILVIGGAGYIGSVTVERLLGAGHLVTVLDDLSRGHRGAVADGAALVVGNYGDGVTVSRVVKDAASAGAAIEAAVHFGASSLVGESVQNPALYYRNNVANGIELVRALVEGGVQQFVFSSTAAVYGEPREIPITEDLVKAPTNPYGRTKLYFENFLADMETAVGLRSICLRYFNAAGASERFGEDHDPETHLIPLVLQVAAGKRKDISIFGDDYPTRDGTCIRDYIHVEDLADAHLLALEKLVAGAGSDQYNLGNGEGFNVLEVIAAAEKVTGRQVARRVEARRAGDPATLVASAEKARRDLGWAPRKGELETIIADAWRWMGENPGGYEQ